MTATALKIREAPQRAEYRPTLRLVAPPQGCGNRGRGRPKGSKNFLKMEVQRMLYDALIAAGGVEYLKRQAEENPVAFLALVGKLIPTRTAGGDDVTATARPLPKIERWIVEPDGTRYEYGRQQERR